MLRYTLAICGLLTCVTASRAGADELVEYLFWESAGNQVGKGVQSYIEYRAERQSWEDKIADAKRQMEACGGGASAKAELERWQKVEGDFQYVAGGLAASVGMPPAMAKFLNIDMPMAPPPPREEVRIASPDWISDRTPECQAAVNEHLSCLHRYQAERQQRGEMTTTLAPARLVGAPCYESSRLYGYCAAKDYKGFLEETRITKLRDEGAVIPQVQGDEQYINVYYGRVPNDFFPRFPPEDVLLAELADETHQIRFFTLKQGAEVLDQAAIIEAHHSNIAPGNECFDGRSQREELERRVCEDLNLVTWHVRYHDQPYTILQCDYTKEGGSFRSGAVAQDLEWDPDSRFSRRYWYSRRPEMADPKGLVERHANHPLLRIGAPRMQCPESLKSAEAVDVEYLAELGQIRNQVEQVSASIVMPVPEVLRKYREGAQKRNDDLLRLAQLTSAFPVEGVYEFSMHKTANAMAGTCSIAAVAPPVLYHAACETRDGVIAASTQLVGYSGLDIQWSEGSVRYLIDPDHEQELVGRVDGVEVSRLVRRGDLVGVNDVSLLGAYELEMSKDSETIRGNCDVTPRAGTAGAYYATCLGGTPGEFKVAIHPRSFGPPGTSGPNQFFAAGWEGNLPKFGGRTLSQNVYVLIERPLDKGEPTKLVFHSPDVPAFQWRLTSIGSSEAKAKASAEMSAGQIGNTSPGSKSEESQPDRDKSCMPEDVAGNYGTTLGILNCDANSAGLDCCVRGDCNKPLALKLSDDRRLLAGNWTVTDGVSMPVEFDVDAQCNITTGRLWKRPGQPGGPWKVYGRE